MIISQVEFLQVCVFVSFTVLMSYCSYCWKEAITLFYGGGIMASLALNVLNNLYSGQLDYMTRHTIDASKSTFARR